MNCRSERSLADRGLAARLTNGNRDSNLQTLSIRVRNSTKQVGSLALLGVPGRLARKLLELAQQHGRVESSGVRVKLAFTQSDLAGMIGTTRESINKALGGFKRQGWIQVEQGRITIVDPDELRAISS